MITNVFEELQLDLDVDIMDEDQEDINLSKLSEFSELSSQWLELSELSESSSQLSDLPRLSASLKERIRCWIIVLIYNEALNNLYVNNFNICEQILLPYYEVKILSFYAMRLELLNYTEFDIFCMELSKCKKLEKLDLTKNNLSILDELQFIKLLDAIRCCNNLQYLFLSDNGLIHKQMLYIKEHLNIGFIDFGVDFSKEVGFLRNNSNKVALKFKLSPHYNDYPYNKDEEENLSLIRYGSIKSRYYVG